MIRSFEDMLQQLQEIEAPMPVAVAAAEDEQTLTACIQAAGDGLIQPIFIGDERVIGQRLEALGATAWQGAICAAADAEESAWRAVDLARTGKVGAIMKGKLETHRLLKSVVNKTYGIGTGRLMTHIVFNEVPSYHKLLLTTDGGMVTYPTFEEKIEILKNALEVLWTLGYKTPKVACLAAVEQVNAKMPETVDARHLQEMAAAGELGDCLVEGPLSFDLAYSKEVCRLKGFETQVGGDADVLLMPNIAVGNVLGKSLLVAARGRMAGVVYGAQVPIVLTSRGASAEEKYLSAALSALISHRSQGTLRGPA